MTKYIQSNTEELKTFINSVLEMKKQDDEIDLQKILQEQLYIMQIAENKS